MVNSDGQITKPATATAETVKSKKKRPRVRVRSRNKAVRLSKLNTEEKQLDTRTEAIGKPIEEPRDQPILIAETQTFAEQSDRQKTVPTEQPKITEEIVTMQSAVPATTTANAAATAKTREQIMAEREAKKLAKQAKKLKSGNEGDNISPTASTTDSTASAKSANGESKAEVTSAVPNAQVTATNSAEKTREQIKAEREAKKLAKQAAKVNKSGTAPATTVESTTQQIKDLNIATTNQPIEQQKKKPELTKAERRAIQEAQRAAKAQAQAQKTATPSAAKSAALPKAPAKTETVVVKTATSPVKSSLDKPKDCRVKLFNHLKSIKRDASSFANNTQIHPSITRLGEQYAKRTIVGSNARCIAFLNALKMVIHDFETPPKKEFARSLEVNIKTCVDHLQQCRPLAVSVCNVYKHINNVLRQLPTDQPESDLKQNLCHFIETYIENQIGKAAQAISSSLQEKIIDGDVLLTFGCSSLIHFICEEAQKRQVDFRVIIVDSRPFYEGQELLRRLSAKGIPCTYVLINALGYVMPEATKVLLGAHALLSNGYVMARTGTAQVALVARSFNVPVLVCCETHKFSERFQTDAIVYNELGNPDDLIVGGNSCCLANWEAKGKLSPLNLNYDITPPELVTAVVTEVSILPCTSVPVILRIKPTEIGYYC